jgi:hypothetical protein
MSAIAGAVRRVHADRLCDGGAGIGAQGRRRAVPPSMPLAFGGARKKIPATADREALIPGHSPVEECRHMQPKVAPR